MDLCLPSVYTVLHNARTLFERRYLMHALELYNGL